MAYIQPFGKWSAAAIGHALDFETWSSLTRWQGLSNEQAVDLMVQLVLAAAGRPP